MFRNIYISNAFIFYITALLYSTDITASDNANQLPESSINNGKNVKIIIDTDSHPHFKDFKRRCLHYWPYYQGKINKPDGSRLSKLQCRRNAQLISLSTGYAPLGVFFRSKILRNEEDIKEYRWTILGPIVNNHRPVIAKYNSFNASMIFENPGEYRVNLTVIFKDNSKANDTTSVTVWPRDGRTFYVDSVSGDDRFDGLSMQPNPECKPDKMPVGKCEGPWKSATRAFSVLSPRKWINNKTQNYGAESVCHSYITKTLYLYPRGHYSPNKVLLNEQSEAIKDKNGNHIKIDNTKICTNLANIGRKKLKPGDQILFKRGQTFTLESGMITATREDLNNVNHKYSCTPFISNNHWSYPPGLLFSAYGNGDVPVINNTSNLNCFLFEFSGNGLFHLAFQDLTFNMDGGDNPQLHNRGTFMFANGHPLNLIFNRIKLKQFGLGILFHNAHGMFINNSEFLDSSGGVLFSETASDVSLINNTFDYSGNHISYTNMSNALVKNNTFRRHAFGRTALRIYGSNERFKTESIWISDNIFEGWVDTRTRKDCVPNRQCQYANGKRYNWSLVELRPNVPDIDLFMEKIVLKNNTFKNAETMLDIGAAHNVLVDNNIFDNADINGEARIKLHNIYARHPLQRITISNNKFVEHNRDKVFDFTMIDLFKYDNENDNHRDIIITNNYFNNINNNCIFRINSPGKNNKICYLNKKNNLTKQQSSKLPFLYLNNNTTK